MAVEIPYNRELDFEYGVAAELSPLEGDSDDFTDFVVQLESITPVPEPGMLGLLGFTLLGLGMRSRRRQPRART